MAEPLQFPTIDIAFNSNEWRDKKHWQTLVHRAIKAACENAPLRWPAGAELSIVLTSDEEMQKINAAWRNINKPTNVLSFPGENIVAGEPSGSMIGDIILAYETLVSEANEQELGVDHHFSHLLVHGFLHLFGFDHETPIEAKTMEQLESLILARLGIADPNA